MNSVLQDILKYNPNLDDSGDGLKISHAIGILVDELERQSAANGRKTLKSEEDRVMALLRDGDNQLFHDVDSLVGMAIILYESAAFALGYHTAKHPEWLIFYNQIDDDMLDRLRAPLPD